MSSIGIAAVVFKLELATERTMVSLATLAGNTRIHLVSIQQHRNAPHEEERGEGWIGRVWVWRTQLITPPKNSSSLTKKEAKSLTNTGSSSVEDIYPM